jgi:phosphoribosyl-dephospho-CoA transferase
MRRHDWVYLRRGSQPAFAPADDAALHFARDWVAQGGPLVAARQYEAGGKLALGLSLPVEHVTRRLACAVDHADVVRSRNPLTVEEASHVLPAGDVDALHRFAEAVAGHALQVGVYGSTAWEAMSGLRYRHEASDVDVVCDVASSAGLSACLAAFKEGTRDLRSRLDGEIRFAGGRAVAWRELAEACAGTSGLVLVKGERDVALLSLHRVLASLR